MQTAPVSSGNIKHLCRLETAGGGQITIDGHYAYIGHQNGPEGTTIMDISDPCNPRTMSVIMVPNAMTHTHKVRVVGDIMIVNCEQQPGSGRREDFVDGGFRVFDIKDRANPKLISIVKTHGKGVHRFDMDEKYVYVSTEVDGFVGNILAIYDISNPAKPFKVSHWWLPGQNIAAGEAPHPRKTEHRLHHALRCGDEMYAGYWGSGLAILDVSDIANPRTLSHYEYEPREPEPTHTFLKAPFKIGGRSIAVSTEEERTKRGPDEGKPHAPFRTWDVSDPTKPKLLFSHHVPEAGAPFAGPGVRFGAHQLREKIDADCLCYITWFAAGLRILDISNPDAPRERGFFIPQPGVGKTQPYTNDVSRDDRGLVFFTDKACGLDVIECRF